MGIEEINVKEHESWQWVLGNVFRSDKLGFRCQISSWNDIESNLKDSRYFFLVARGNSVVLSFWVISAVRENIGQWSHIYNFSSIFFFTEWACTDNLSMHMAPMWYQNGHLLRHGTTCEKQTPHVSESRTKNYIGSFHLIYCIFGILNIFLSANVVSCKNNYMIRSEKFIVSFENTTAVMSFSSFRNSKRFWMRLISDDNFSIVKGNRNTQENRRSVWKKCFAFRLLLAH